MSDYEKGIEAMGNTRLSHRLSPAELGQLAGAFLAEQPKEWRCVKGYGMCQHVTEKLAAKGDVVAQSHLDTGCGWVRIVVTP